MFMFRKMLSGATPRVTPDNPSGDVSRPLSGALEGGLNAQCHVTLQGLRDGAVVLGLLSRLLEARRVEAGYGPLHGQSTGGNLGVLPDPKICERAMA